MLPDKYYLVKKEDLAHNIQILRKKIPGKIYAVLKADGYGLGCGNMAQICRENGLRCFAVTEVREAEVIAELGIDFEELLLMSVAAPEQIPHLVQLGVTFTVTSQEDARHLAGHHAKVHIKVDTGMGRRGFSWSEPERIAALYAQYPDIQFTGIYTHLAAADDRSRAQAQYAKFQKVLQLLEDRGIDPGTRHCCNSGGAIWQPELYLDGVRVGSALLGRHPGAQSRMGLRRVGMGYVRIESVRQLPKGAEVGYGSLWRAKKPTKVALCPVGTHHGLGLVSNKGRQTPWQSLLDALRSSRNRLTNRNLPSVLVGGKSCPCLGSVCSEMAMVDVTDVACQSGDFAQVDINPILMHGLPIIVE